MKILVCGGRDFGDLRGIIKVREPELYAKRLAQNKFITVTLDRLAANYSKHYNPNDNWLPADIIIIQGGARGADRCADEWAVVNFCMVEEYTADWSKHGRLPGQSVTKKCWI